MKFLNKDITGIILSNLTINSIKKFMKLTRCKYTLTLLIKHFLNKNPYTLVYRNPNAIFQSTILNKEYHISIPNALKRSYLNTIYWIESIAQGVFIIYQGVKIIFANINKRKCSVLQITRKIYSLAVNRELSAIAICYNDHKLKSICLKVYNSEGKIMYCLPLNFRIKKMVFDNDYMYYNAFRSELRRMNLANKEDSLVYNKCKIERIYLKNNYLFVIIKKAIMLINTRDLHNISFIKLDKTPQCFYSLSDYSFLVLYENLFFYEFNIYSQSLKRLYFEVDMKKERAHCYEIYSESKDNLILLNNKIYYIINKSNMKCIFKGYCDYDSFYIDGIKNKLLSFRYSGLNNTISLSIKEYELFDFSKAINVYNLLSNQGTYYMCYQIPHSKNCLIRTDREQIYYYNYLANTVEAHLLNTSGGHNIVPLSDTLICCDFNDDVFLYNLLTKVKTIIAKCQYLMFLDKLNNYLVILNRTIITIYDLKLRCVSDEITFDYIYKYKTYFNCLIYVETQNEKFVYTIKCGLLNKLWNGNYLYLSSDDHCVYIFAKDNQMMCIDKDANIICKLASKENVKNTNLSLKDKEILSCKLKRGFDN
jgi:hypothetical protein